MSPLSWSFPYHFISQKVLLFVRLRYIVSPQLGQTESETIGMNIDDMTFGDLKKIAAMFSSTIYEKETPSSPPTPEVPDFSGRYVIVRTRNEGVNAGLVVENGAGFVHLKNARRLWKIIPPSSSEKWYEGVALSGLGAESQISVESEKLISEDYSITVCSAAAEANIREFK